MFVFNSLTELPGGEVVAYIGYDQRAGGRKVGLKAVELLHSKYGELKGKVAILEGVPGYHTTERKGGFMEILNKFPEIEGCGFAAGRLGTGKRNERHRKPFTVDSRS